MLKNLLFASLVILIAAVLTFGFNNYFKTKRGDFLMLEKGEKISNFSFKALNGSTYDFYDYISNPTIIHFWATWCAPCVVEFPELVSFAKINPDITVLAFSSDRNPARINRFLDEYASNLPENFIIIHDKDLTVTQKKFSVFALPESFIVEKNGILDSHIVGAYADWSSLKL